jgi:hypothetical protein
VCLRQRFEEAPASKKNFSPLIAALSDVGEAP